VTAKLKKEASRWEDLSDVQQRAVLWLIETKGSYADLIATKLVSSNTLYAVWTVKRVEGWKQLYKTYCDENAPIEQRTQAQIESLADSAVRCLRDTLRNGEGNATAVRAAQWVLEQVFNAHAIRTKAPPIPNVGPNTAEKELSAVLRLVK